MLRICYMSRARPSTTEDDVRDILRASRDRNVEDGVTGLLLHDGERYLQAIEGPAEQTAACYGRIHNDPRHHGIRLVSQGDIEAREFGEWSMTYRSPADLDAATFLGTVRQDVRGVRDDYLQMLFTGFAARRG